MRAIKEIKVVFLLLVLFCLFLFLAIISEGSFGGEDSFNHYLISKYSFEHPGLLLNQWGKPIFTLLSSPFSQFGFIGIKIFNIVLSVFSAYLTYLVAKKFNKKNPVRVIFFLFFTPLYFVIVLSGMTEILFGFVLILSIYLFLDKKIIASLIVTSFLPFVRSGGFIVIFIYLCLLFFNRRFFLMPLLSLGTIIYGLAGFLYTQDILWLINFNPYIKYASDIYGQGSFYHYITHLPDVVGIVLYFLLLLGILHMIFSLLSSKTKISSDKLVLEIFLVYSIFFSFLIFYSFIWWKGLFLSGGQMRIMVSMVPLISLICLNGYNHLVKIFKNTIIRKSFHFIVLLFVILIPFIKYDFPIQLDPEQKLMKEVGEWYISSDYRGYMLYYFYPFLSYTANIDHFDSSKVRPLNTILYKEVSKDSIIIWDSFFGPTVSDVPLDFIKNNEDYILVKTFISEKERDIEEPEFEVYIFQKV